MIWEILEALLFIYQRQKNFKLSEKQTMTLFKCLQSMIPVAQLFVENLNLNQELEEISKKELVNKIKLFNFKFDLSLPFKVGRF